MALIDFMFYITYADCLIIAEEYCRGAYTDAICRACVEYNEPISKFG